MERGKLLFVSFIKMATCLGLGQTTIIIIDIRIESCACTYSNIYMIINWHMYNKQIIVLYDFNYI